MFKKLFFRFTIIILLGIIITGTIVYFGSTDAYYQTVKDSLSNSTNYILTDLDIENYGSMKNYSDSMDTRITIIDTQGVVLYDTNANAEDLVNHANRPEIASALQGSPEYSTRVSTSVKEEMLYYAIPVYDNEDIVAVLRASVSIANINSITNNILKDVFISIFAGLILSLLITFIVLRTMIKPIKELKLYADDLTDGKYYHKIILNRKDEVGSLTNSLNTLSRRLENTFDKLQRRQSELESVLASINSGVIAIDNDKNIILLNQSAKEMFELADDDYSGKFILDAVRNRDFYEYVKQTINTGFETNENEIRKIGDAYYSLFASSIFLGEQLIGHTIVIRDITELVKMEQMRKSLIANVTHELKTPVTSIMGYSETLMSGVDSKEIGVDFYGIINRESKRLLSLIEDILVLSRLESDVKYNEEKDTISIKSEIESIAKLFEIKAKEKNININIPTNDKEIVVNFNRENFTRMISNLVDNAIKYNKDGGSIEIDIGQDDTDNIIKVSDTGHGISKDMYQKIFHRFFRVDGDLSGSEPGTGLGLAIVKHILENEGGRITVESEVGKGSTFKIFIPKR